MITLFYEPHQADLNVHMNLSANIFHLPRGCMHVGSFSRQSAIIVRHNGHQIVMALDKHELEVHGIPGTLQYST